MKRIIATVTISLLALAICPAYAGQKSCHKHKHKHHKHTPGISASANAANKVSVNTNTSVYAPSHSNSAATAYGGDSAANSSATTGPSTATITQEREYLNTPDVEYGPTQPYLGDDGPGFGYGDIRDLLYGRVWFTEGALESLAAGGKAQADYHVVNPGAGGSPGQSASKRWIKIVLTPARYPGVDSPLVDGVRPVELNGYATAWALKDHTTMLEVFGAMALSALQSGCNVLHITAYGYMKPQRSTGTGAGGTGATANVSGILALGIGISASDQYAWDRSWLRGVGIVDRTLQPPTR